MSTRAVEKTIDFAKDWTSLELPASVIEVLGAASSLLVPNSREDLLNWALGREAGATDWSISNREDKGEYVVSFDVPARVTWSRPWSSRPATGFRSTMWSRP
ncbi:MAG TPA: hypothetical protein VK786_05015 [bacterium]|nr:hypothetical protein [bacterium]